MEHHFEIEVEKNFFERSNLITSIPVEKQDCCHDHKRDFSEMRKGNMIFPASDHAPTCPNYVEKTFFVYIFREIGVIERTKEELIKKLDFYCWRYDPFFIEEVSLTEDQYLKAKRFWEV